MQGVPCMDFCQNSTVTTHDAVEYLLLAATNPPPPSSLRQVSVTSIFVSPSISPVKVILFLLKQQWHSVVSQLVFMEIADVFVCLCDKRN